MVPREPDPLHLDVESFAEHAQRLEGSGPLAAFVRLAEMAHPEALPAEGDTVDWRARGERRAARGQAPQTWLHLDARAPISLVCQRCLRPLAMRVHAERSLRFVEGEDEAARLDAESDDDVLATSRSLDLLALVEDELLLALPLVPRHADCRMPLPAATAGPDLEALAAADEKANPFAVLAALKGRGSVD